MTNTSEIQLLFLKLGGSLITYKDQVRQARFDVISQLVGEIAQVKKENPQMSIILGHGSGSFGHIPAKKYGTRLGVKDHQGWKGFVEVWRDAHALHQIVMDACVEVGLLAVSFPPVASVISNDAKILQWDLQPIQSALVAGIVPVVFGDVIFDQSRGGTILSTEDLFTHLAYQLQPQRILLAGIEPGVWVDYPECTHLASLITPSGMADVYSKLSGSHTTDVTGGMLSKVVLSLDWVQHIPGLQVQIFSGRSLGSVRKALLGDSTGTLIKAD